MRVECFISYSRQDIEIARQIISLLENEGIDPWWDEKLSLGTHFRQEIANAISCCQCFLVIWTSNSVQSQYVTAEAARVRDQEKMVSISIDHPSLPLPFGELHALQISLTKDREFEEKDKGKILSAVKSRIGIIGKNEHIIHPRSIGETWEYGDLAIETPVPGTNILSSFRPFGKNGTFLIMRFQTTEGWVDAGIPSARERSKPFKNDLSSSYIEGENEYLKIRNDILFIKDPIRPYSIQIGGIRSERPNSKPGTIEAKMIKGELKQLPTNLTWLSLTLAEILTDKDSLEELSQKIESLIASTESRIFSYHSQENKILDEDLKKEFEELEDMKGQLNKVKATIARNPFAPLDIQKASCRFCDVKFKQKRRLDSNKGATLIANDFPFGPNFHYVAILDEPIHSWEDVSYQHLLALNQLTHNYLSTKSNRREAAGLEYGFNSSVRHLVLGRKTHSSAGASIPHIHKQIWGMVTNTTNLADQLITVSDAYSNFNIDYQGCYIDALRDAGYVIWEDRNVVLYVPYGQIATHELQIMMRRKFRSYVDFTDKEIESLSVAEFMVFRIYEQLGITSFNSIFLSKLFEETRAPDFRVVQIFVTREADLAVSELSTLYVVDQHPNESMQQIKKFFRNIEQTLERANIIRDHASLADTPMEMVDLFTKGNRI